MTEGTGHVIDPAGDARRALQEAVAEHGPEALSDATIMDNLCRTQLTALPGECILIVSAARADVPALLRDKIPQLGNYGAIQSVATTLAEAHDLDNAASLWVVREFARALGLIAPGGTQPIPRPGRTGRAPGRPGAPWRPGLVPRARPRPRARWARAQGAGSGGGPGCRGPGVPGGPSCAGDGGRPAAGDGGGPQPGMAGGPPPGWRGGRRRGGRPGRAAQPQHDRDSRGHRAGRGLPGGRGGGAPEPVPGQDGGGDLVPVAQHRAEHEPEHEPGRARARPGHRMPARRRTTTSC